MTGLLATGPAAPLRPDGTLACPSEKSVDMGMLAMYACNLLAFFTQE